MTSQQRNEYFQEETSLAEERLRFLVQEGFISRFNQTKLPTTNIGDNRFDAVQNFLPSGTKEYRIDMLNSNGITRASTLVAIQNMKTGQIIPNVDFEDLDIDAFISISRPTGVIIDYCRGIVGNVTEVEPIIS